MKTIDNAIDKIWVFLKVNNMCTLKSAVALKILSESIVALISQDKKEFDNNENIVKFLYEKYQENKIKEICEEDLFKTAIEKAVFGEK